MTANVIELNVPSPVRRLLVQGARELWVKDDGRICSEYGGNKPRKLQHLLDRARSRHATRLVTVGALGSHHVLATGLLGRRVGLPTVAITLPRPYGLHAEQTTRQILNAGVELIPLGNPWDLRGLLTRLWRRGDHWIPAGGSNGLGALGYFDAAGELKRQIGEQQIPEPDVVVVALGSGGTAAGLIAGFHHYGIGSHLIAVPVLKLPLAGSVVRFLARAAMRRSNSPPPTDFCSRFDIDAAWIGRGYGHPTTAGELAIGQAESLGLQLEPTYTAKAFACALAWLRGSKDQSNVSSHAKDRRCHRSSSSSSRESVRILFWSTISAVSLATSVDDAATLPQELNQLFRKS